MVALVLSLVVVLLVVAFYKFWLATYLAYRHIPGPPAVPLLGNLAELAAKPYHYVHDDYIKRYGPVVRFFVGQEPWVLVADPAVIHEYSVSGFKNFVDRPPPSQPLKKDMSNLGLLRAKGEYWRKIRRIIAPTFNVMHLKEMLPHVRAATAVMMDHLAAHSNNKQEMDIHNYMSRLTMDIIGRVAFGTELDALKDSEHPISIAAKTVFQGTTKPAPLLSIIFRGRFAQLQREFFPHESFRESRKAFNFLEKELAKVLEERKAQRKEANKNVVGGKPIKDFLDLMLDAEDKTTGETLLDIEIVMQSITFLLAGHETTSNAIAYTIFLLAQHPEVDALLFEELKEIELENLDFQGVKNLKRMSMVVKESLRLYPPAVVLPRVAQEDCNLAGYFIPKGTIVAAPVYHIHHNEKYWPKPEKFLPFERWNEEAEEPQQQQPASGATKEKKAALTWLPFGLGPRGCIGERFALMEAKVILALILRSYKFTLSPGIKLPLEVVAGITVYPKNGIPVLVHRRDE